MENAIIVVVKDKHPDRRVERKVRMGWVRCHPKFTRTSRILVGVRGRVNALSISDGECEIPHPTSK